jgi:hypothetical protein
MADKMASENINHQGPLVYPKDGSTPFRVEGYKDLKVGDVFSVCGMPRRIVTEGPAKSERSDNAWRIKSKAI